MKNRIVLFVAVLAVLIVGVVGYVHFEFGKARQHAETAVLLTVESIKQMGALEASNLDAITNAGIRGAQVLILNTNPVVFRVSTMTPWPDLMIYHYDSNKPERGVCHYSF